VIEVAESATATTGDLVQMIERDRQVINLYAYDEYLARLNEGTTQPVS
jgi:hypothetical protein